MFWRVPQNLANRFTPQLPQWPTTTTVFFQTLLALGCCAGTPFGKGSFCDATGQCHAWTGKHEHILHLWHGCLHVLCGNKMFEIWSETHAWHCPGSLKKTFDCTPLLARGYAVASASMLAPLLTRGSALMELGNAKRTKHSNNKMNIQTETHSHTNTYIGIYIVYSCCEPVHLFRQLGIA